NNRQYLCSLVISTVHLVLDYRVYIYRISGIKNIFFLTVFNPDGSIKNVHKLLTFMSRGMRISRLARFNLYNKGFHMTVSLLPCKTEKGKFFVFGSLSAR